MTMVEKDNDFLGNQQIEKDEKFRELQIFAM